MKTIKAFKVTHIESGEVRYHVGTAADKLSAGAMSLPLGNWIPPMNWSPSADWKVEEVSQS